MIFLHIPPILIIPSVTLSAYTEATTLISRQSTLEDLDGMPECIPKTSERARPKLRKMYSMDMSNSSVDSGSSFISRFLASASPVYTSVSLHLFQFEIQHLFYCTMFTSLFFSCTIFLLLFYITSTSIIEHL